MTAKDIIHFEELSMNTHPAIKTYFYDGWILRFANGYTNRANSVNPLYESELPVNEKIDFCEKLYAEQGLSTVFKLTPSSSILLDNILEERGYKTVTPTNLMINDIPNISIHTDRVMIANGINETWQSNYFKLSGISGNKTIQTAKLIQANIQNKILCATLENDDKTTACGLCVIERDYACLLDIVVDSSYRGRGHGYELCSSLIVGALQYGVKNIYLQVVAENAPALALYKKLGFKYLYQYWYRVKNLERL